MKELGISQREIMKIYWNQLTPRQRDMAVEQYVFGRVPLDTCLCWNEVPHYTTSSIDGAKVKKKFKAIRLTKGLQDFGTPEWEAWVMSNETKLSGIGQANSEDEAVCIAALRSAGIEVITNLK